MKRTVTLVFVVALLLLTVSAALAGGWAVVTLDSPPGEVHAGEPWTMGFTVLQHGQTPVHNLGPGSPVSPLLVATNADNGRRVEVDATPTDEVGHFVVEVTFPTEGNWAWTIYPNPLAGETMFEPLTVLPAASVVEPAQPAAAPVAAPVVEEAGLALPGLLRWGAVGAVLLAAALFVVQWRRPAAVRS